MPTQTTPNWTADQIPDLTGRSVIVTGANSGLGFATARDLARHGASVMIPVRDAAKGKQAAARIAEVAPGSRVEVRVLDLGVANYHPLSSLDS